MIYMSNDLQTQKEILEHNLTKLLEFVTDKTEPREAIKIYENAISIVRANLEKIGKLEQMDSTVKYKCRKCGSEYDSFPIKTEGRETILCIKCNSDQIELI